MNSSAENTSFYGDVLTQTREYKEPPIRPNRSSMISNHDFGTRNKYIEVLFKDMVSRKLRYQSRLNDVEKQRSNFEPLSFPVRLANGLSRKNFVQTAGVGATTFIAFKEVLPESQKKYAALASVVFVLGSAYLTGQVAYEERLDEQEKWYESRIDSIDKSLLDITRSMN